MAITKLESAGTLFVGQGDLIIYDSLADSAYASATLSSFTNPKSLGQIVQDSTSWDGEDASTEQIKDEQGNVITATAAAGTLAFSFEIASTSAAMVKKFLKGTEISVSSAVGFENPTACTGFGTEIPTFTAPIAIINDEKKRAFIYPKAKITSNLSYADGLWRIKASVVAQTVNTANLRTAMVLEAAADYGSSSNVNGI